jgi:predicted DNA-binding protein (MmcQ/YjbR family)
LAGKYIRTLAFPTIGRAGLPAVSAGAKFRFMRRWSDRNEKPKMNVDAIRAYCLSFPETTEKLQWGDALCFKVREKMFAVLGLDQVRLTFKCTPEAFVELTERPDIRPSPYLARYNWVMLDRLDALPSDQLKDQIRQSYEMVEAKAPKAKARQPKRKKKIRPEGQKRKARIKKS